MLGRCVGCMEIKSELKQIFVSNERSHDRTIADVINIFKDITGLLLETKAEETVIKHWCARGWTNHDFRLVIEYHFNNTFERTFLDKPGNMNLRMMLNPARADRLIDIVRDLRWKAKQADEKKISSSKSYQTSMVLLRCGAKIPVGDIESYSRHIDECFNMKGKCFN